MKNDHTKHSAKKKKNWEWDGELTNERIRSLVRKDRRTGSGRRGERRGEERRGEEREKEEQVYVC